MVVFRQISVAPEIAPVVNFTHLSNSVDQVNILVVGINYWPETFGIGPFNTGRCEYLATRGHRVSICTGFPYYPEWRVRTDYHGRICMREMRNSVEIIRVRSYVPRRPNTRRRIMHEASFVAAALLRILARKRPDVLLVVSPPLALGIAAAMVSRIWSVPFVFHVEDLQPDAANDLGMMNDDRLIALLFRLEVFVYRRAALVSTLTPGMRQRIVTKGISAGKVAVFPQWAAPELFALGTGGRGEKFRQEHELQGKSIVLHAGNMGVKQGLEVVLEAAKLSRRDSGIIYLLVGDGAARPELEKYAKRIGVSNVRFLPPQYGESYLGLLEAADLSLITQQSSVSDIVFPSKIPQLMAAARPLVASVNLTSEVAKVIKEAQAGLVVAPEDSAGLYAAIQSLARDKRDQLGQKARSYALSRWDRLRALKIMEQHLLAVVPRPVNSACSCQQRNADGMDEPPLHPEEKERRGSLEKV